MTVVAPSKLETICRRRPRLGVALRFWCGSSCFVLPVVGRLVAGRPYYLDAQRPELAAHWSARSRSRPTLLGGRPDAMTGQPHQHHTRHDAADFDHRHAPEDALDQEATAPETKRTRRLTGSHLRRRPDRRLHQLGRDRGQPQDECRGRCMPSRKACDNATIPAGIDSQTAGPIAAARGHAPAPAGCAPCPAGSRAAPRPAPASGPPSSRAPPRRGTSPAVGAPPPARSGRIRRDRARRRRRGPPRPGPGRPLAPRRSGGEPPRPAPAPPPGRRRRRASSRPNPADGSSPTAAPGSGRWPGRRPGRHSGRGAGCGRRAGPSAHGAGRAPRTPTGRDGG